MFEVLLNPVVFLVSVWVARGWSATATRHPALSRRLVLLFYTALLLMLALAALPALGVVHGSEVALYIVQAHGLVTAFLVLLLLQYRAHVIGQQQRHVALALERSELQVQQEREIRTEQEKLLAMLAHELKTPLATMHMRLDANASGGREIKQAIRDMNGVIERCQQTLQLSDRQLSPHPEMLDMVSLVRDAVSACASPQRVQLQAPPQLLVRSDRQLWFIVLNNLLENACKYAAPDAPIALHLDTLADAAGARLMQLEVANAPGKADWPDASQVFEKYYRSPHARRQAGTGLGLYLVRNLVQVMGGRIDYVPTAQTVRFVLQLPLDTKQAA
jgi:signal transduction histidine kinase